jgi:hypothetical protein
LTVETLYPASDNIITSRNSSAVNFDVRNIPRMPCRRAAVLKFVNGYRS